VRGADDPAARYVGRGGLKMEKALAEFQIDPTGLVCLDVGASTGGFTDCLLQHGARRVVALDVGHNQIDWRLRTDSRVEVREGVNARHLTPRDFDESFDLIVVDVSFISATKVLPALAPLLKEGGRVVVLVKPQFEAGRSEIRKGVIRDAGVQSRVLEEVSAAAREVGLIPVTSTPSPITGAKGNVEFLLHLRP
jgi:23S rRNA (cytidine1920-2'-O)/16S rRNA (cytidine1409-2'-O)-methyltransferase